MGLVSTIRANAVDVAQKWAATGFLVFLASSFFLASSRQKTVFYMLVAVPSLLLFIRFKSLLRENIWPLLSVLAFLAYFSASSLWSGVASESLEDSLKFSLSILCLMLGADAACRRFSPEFFTRSIAWVGGFAAFLYLAVILWKTPDFATLLADRSSFRDLTGWGASNPISSAIYLGLAILAAWWLLPNEARHVQLGLIVVIAVSMVILFLTKSRGPMLALFATLLLLSLCRRSRTDITLLLTGCFAALAIVLTTDILSLVIQRATEPNYRMEIWTASLEQIKQNWAFGQGFGHEAGIQIKADKFVTHAHASMLEVFRVGGLLGGGLLLGMLFSLSKGAMTHRRGLFFLLWLVYGLLCLSTNGRMLLSRPSIEWFGFWIPLFLLYFSTRPEAVELAADEQSAKGLGDV
ncbi:O-antigen ligase family protein [Pseudomonas sp. EA_35y_Pfl2_R111]|uniref:O-antigen ligase family protein n=1 Tax=Pseudomonas sp. EA_35y_Pfl2_R111 TaxID=3088689 RepID=UPI0030DC7373